MTHARILAWTLGALITLVGGSAVASEGALSQRPSLGRDLGEPERVEIRPEFSEPSGEIALRDALLSALLHNPGLAADAWEIRARDAEMIQASRRPNPELALELENFAGSGPFGGIDAVETTIALSHVIELGGKRAKRVEVARLDRDLAAWDYEVRRIDVLTETAAAFVHVLAAQERVALADTLVKVAEGVLTSVSRRVRTGGVSPVEERRARVSLETSRVDRDRSARSLDVARARLGTMWGSSIPRFERAIGDLEVAAGTEVPSLQSLRDRLDESPELVRWTIELDQRRANQAFVQSEGVGDLTLGGGVRHFNEPGEGALVFDLTIPLPVFDRSRDAAAAGERRVRRAMEDQRDARSRVQFALASAHAALSANANEAVALRDQILPEADLAFAESHKAYTRGRLRLTDVLDAERSAFELRGRYVDVLTNFHVLVAEIERLLGAPLFEAVGGSPR